MVGVNDTLDLRFPRFFLFDPLELENDSKVYCKYNAIFIWKNTGYFDILHDEEDEPIIDGKVF